MERYRNSGKISFKAFILAPLFIVAGLILGVIYQFGLDILPWIYVTFALTAGAGVCTFGASYLLVELGHCRNEFVGAAMSALIGLAVLVGGFGLLHVQSVQDTEEYYRTGFMQDDGQISEEEQVAIDEILAQHTFLKTLEFRSEGGWYVGSADPEGEPSISGFMVYLIWLIEAVGIVGPALYAGFVMSKNLYDEAMHQWYPDGEVVLAIYVEDTNMLERVKAATNVREVMPTDDEIKVLSGMSYLRYRIRHIESSPSPAYLDVAHEYMEIDGEGNEKHVSNAIIKGVKLELAQVELIKKYDQRREQLQEQQLQALEAAAAAEEQSQSETDEEEFTLEKEA